MLPMLVISVAQTVLIFAVSLVISWVVGTPLSLLGLLASTVTLVPSALMFIGFGLLFGTLFSDKSAPGLCSIIISLGSFLGCIWFDADATGGAMLTICRALPFYYCTRSARSAVQLNFTMDGWGLPLIIVAGCAAALLLISSRVFHARMKADLA